MFSKSKKKNQADLTKKKETNDIKLVEEKLNYQIKVWEERIAKKNAEIAELEKVSHLLLSIFNLP